MFLLFTYLKKNNWRLFLKELVESYREPKQYTDWGVLGLVVLEITGLIKYSLTRNESYIPEVLLEVMINEWELF